MNVTDEESPESESILKSGQMFFVVAKVDESEPVQVLLNLFAASFRSMSTVYSTWAYNNVRSSLCKFLVLILHAWIRHGTVSMPLLTSPVVLHEILPNILYMHCILP